MREGRCRLVLLALVLVCTVLIIMPSLFYVGDKANKGRYHILCYSFIICGLKIEKEQTRNSYNLPEEVLQILPFNPFEQLDMARKITSIALSTCVSTLESYSSTLCAKLVDKDSHCRLPILGQLPRRFLLRNIQ